MFVPDWLLKATASDWTSEALEENKYAIPNPLDRIFYLEKAKLGASVYTTVNTWQDVQVLNGVAYVLKTITGNTTLTVQQTFVLIDATTGNVTATLPAASKQSGIIFYIARKDTSLNTATIAAAGTDKIQDVASLTLVGLGDSRLIISDGTATWYIMASA